MKKKKSLKSSGSLFLWQANTLVIFYLGKPQVTLKLGLLPRNHGRKTDSKLGTANAAKL